MAVSTASPKTQTTNKPVDERTDVVVYFAGDSGDGIQAIGGQFGHTCVRMGNDIVTFPDFPAEIRAPAGTKAGVSGYQMPVRAHNKGPLPPPPAPRPASPAINCSSATTKCSLPATATTPSSRSIPPPCKPASRGSRTTA